MHIGTSLMAMGSTTARSYYTPWFQRGADNAVFTYEIIQALASGGSFAVVVLHKNREDQGAEGAAVSGATFSQIGTSGFFEAKAVGLKELVRFKITVTPAGVSDGVVYRFLSATWYSKAS